MPTRILTWRVWDVLPVNPPLLKQDPPRSVPGLRNGVARHLRSHMEFGNERNWGILLHAEARGEGRSRRISVDTNPQGKSRRYCQTRIRRVGLGAPRVSIGAEVSCRVMNKRDGPVNELVADQKVTIEVPRRRRQSAVATAEPLKGSGRQDAADLSQLAARLRRIPRLGIDTGNAPSDGRYF